MTFVKPKDHDGIAVDDIIPKTAASPIDIKPSSGGSAYASFDGANTRFRTNKLEPLSGSEIALNSARLTGLGTPTSGTHATTKDYVDGTWANYTPVITATGSMACGAPTIVYARSWTHTDRVFVQVYLASVLSGTASNEVIITLPANPSGTHQLIPAHMRSSVRETLIAEVDTSDNKLHLFREASANYTLAYTEFVFAGFYRKT